MSDTTESRYQAGQVWRYEARPNEQQSTLTVVKVEPHPKLGIIVHVTVQGLQVENRHAQSGVTEKISHMPFTEEALDKSVLELQREHAPVTDDWREGYQEWRQAFDAGKAGVFNITVAEAVDVMEQALSQFR